MHTANSASLSECVDMPPVLFRLPRLCSRSARNDSCSSLSRLDKLTLKWGKKGRGEINILHNNVGWPRPFPF